MKKLILITLLLISTPVLAQSFLDKKCQELSNEITARQKDIVDQQAYVAQLTNDYKDCTTDQQSITDAKAVLQASPDLGVATVGTNWGTVVQ